MGVVEVLVEAEAEVLAVAVNREVASVQPHPLPARLLDRPRRSDLRRRGPVPVPRPASQLTGRRWCIHREADRGCRWAHVPRLAPAEPSRAPI